MGLADLERDLTGLAALEHDLGGLAALEADIAEPGPSARAKTAVVEAFSPRFTGTPEETARHLREQPLSQALLDILSAAGTAAFPGVTAVGSAVTGALSGPTPEPITDLPPSGLAEVTGFESLPGGLPGASELAGMIAGGVFGARGLLRRPAPRVAAPSVEVPAPTPPPPPAPRKALPAFGESGARTTFETGPSTIGKPSEFFRQLPKDVAEDRRVLMETVGRQVKQDVDDVATKAAIVRAQQGKGPRVIDPETGQPVFEPTERISGPRAEATARVGREPVGRADLPSEEFAASTEAPGGRVAGQPQGIFGEAKVYELPDEFTPIGASAKRSVGPPDVALSINVDTQVPPSVFPVTLADRANNWVRAFAGRMSPKRAANLGYDLDIAAAHPASDAIIQAKYRARARIDAVGDELLDTYRATMADVPVQARERIMDLWKRHRFEPREVWLAKAHEKYPQYTAQIAARQKFFDDLGAEMVASGRLTEAQLAKNPNYYPFIRERVRVGQKELNLIESRGDAFFSVWRGSGLTKPFQEFFQKTQRLKAPPRNLTDDVIGRVYTRAIARARVIDNEFMPAVRGNLQGVPANMQEFTMHNINNFLGVPGAESKEIAQWVGVLKQVQATRTLVGLSAPAHNLTQQMVTGARFGRHALMGYTDLGNRALWEQAKRLGVISKYNIKDIGEAVDFGNRVAQAYGKISNMSLGLFRASENTNRMHAFVSGLRDGAARGLTGKGLEQFVIRGVLETQGPIVRTGLTGQFKTFPIFMFNTYKNMIVGAGAGVELAGRGALTGNIALMREGVRRAAPLSRFLVTAGALFGGDVIWPGADEALTKRLVGEVMKLEGIVPYLGLNFAHAVGIGAIPLENWRGLLFFLPGPAATQVAELVSVLTGRRMNPFNAADYKNMGTPFLPTEVDEVRARTIRALPMVGAAQANRLVEAMKRYVAGGDVVAATNWWQAVGAEPATGELVQQRVGAEPASVLERATGSVAGSRAVLEAAGLRPEASFQIQQSMQEIAERNRAITDARSVAGTMFAGGQDDKGEAALLKLQREQGDEALVEALNGLQTSLERAVFARVADRMTRRVITGSRVGLPARAEQAESKRGIIDALVRGLTGR